MDKATRVMPGHKSEYGNVGALLMVGMVFLIGKEKEAHEALKAIADEKSLTH